MALEYTTIQRLEAKLVRLAREKKWLEAELKRGVPKVEGEMDGWEYNHCLYGEPT